MVKDIVPGPEWSFLSQPVPANDKVYFINYSDNGLLWSSDGTADGTARVNDAGLNGVTGLAQLTPAGDKLYFTGYNYATGIELYVGNISDHVAASSNTDITKQTFDKVYPNPVKDVLHVYTNGRAEFSLINQFGKQLLTQTIVNSGNINVSKLAAGVYYLRNNITNQTQKVVVTK